MQPPAPVNLPQPIDIGQYANAAMGAIPDYWNQPAPPLPNTGVSTAGAGYGRG
jgi:hypothetical protein